MRVELMLRLLTDLDLLSVELTSFPDRPSERAWEESGVMLWRIDLLDGWVRFARDTSSSHERRLGATLVE